MALENANYIAEMDDNNPPGTDPKSQGDDHLRLTKRCVQNSFGAFVGTTAAPKSVTLTEDELNDAALKSVSNEFPLQQVMRGGVWMQRGAVLRSNANSPGTPGDASDVDVIGLANGGGVVIGDLLNPPLSMSAHFGGRFFVEAMDTGLAPGLDSYSTIFVTPELGAAEIGTRDGRPRRLAGFRNPGRNFQQADYEAVQADEAGVIDYVNGNFTLTLPTLEENTAITVVNSSSDPITIAEGAGVSFAWLAGTGAPVAGNRTLAGGSVIQAYYHGVFGVQLWGNGLT